MHLRIFEPCPRTWESLEGQGGQRYCDDCNKHVHDLTGEVPDSVRAAVRRGENVCGMLPMPTTPARAPSPAWMAALFAMGLAACAGHEDLLEPDAPQDELACELDPVSGLELCSLPEWWEDADDEDLVPQEVARTVDVEALALGTVSTVRGAVVEVVVEPVQVEVEPRYTMGAVRTTGVVMGGVIEEYQVASERLERSLLDLSTEERELLAQTGRGSLPDGS